MVAFRRVRKRLWLYRLTVAGFGSGLSKEESESGIKLRCLPGRYGEFVTATAVHCQRERCLTQTECLGLCKRPAHVAKRPTVGPGGCPDSVLSQTGYRKPVATDRCFARQSLPAIACWCQVTCMKSKRGTQNLCSDIFGVPAF